ncbi:DUF2637 domain-containing protein [Nocardia tengchongensis]|uniref:DUF2637 domain-containing protein n=1 Tax=Nocardia tengchongensis TaxID=2055889 RepID=UPI0036AC88C0
MTTTDTTGDPQHRVNTSAPENNQSAGPAVGHENSPITEAGVVAEEAAPGGEETPEPARETTGETPAKWDRVEAAALLAVAAVLLAAGGWSAIALHGLSHQAGMPSWLAWGAPVIVDGPLFQSAIALVVLKRRAKAGVRVEPGQRRYFWWTLAMSELISLIGNGAHAAKIPVTPTIAAVIAATAPVAAMAVMHGLTILIEVPRTPDTTGNIGQRLDNPAEKRPNTLSSTASPGDTRLSPPVSPPAAGDSNETQAVSPVSPGDSGTPAEETRDIAKRDARIVAMSESGMTLRQIAPEVGLSRAQVGKIVARLKAQRRHSDDPGGPDDDGGGQVLHLIR